MKKKNKQNDKVKIVSTIISLALILSMVVGIVSVIRSTKKNYNSIVDLNETEADVAFEEKSTAKIRYVGDSSVGDDDLINANARASMSDDGDGTETKAFETIKQTEATTVTEKPTVPTTASAKEVMAAAISKYSFDENKTIMWPVKGEITLNYSMESTTYFKTLGMYKCSPAIVINAGKGTNVSACASGIVTAIWDDIETGKTFTVAVGNGYEITYGMLDNVVLKEGDTVTEGQLIGTIAEPTSYYKEEGPGVYLKIEQEKTPVDPLPFLVE